MVELPFALLLCLKSLLYWILLVGFLFQILLGCGEHQLDTI